MTESSQSAVRNASLMGSNASADQRGRELFVSREIAASREHVFETWMRSLPEWWGPRGTSTIACEVDPRPGGVFRTVLRTADGREFHTRGVFLEVTPSERIVFTDAFDPGWEPHPDVFFTAIVAFRRLPDGATCVETRALHWTAEACAQHERMGFHACWGESLDRLAECATRERRAVP